MEDHWAYDKKKYTDKSGERWYFATRTFLNIDVPYGERPYEIYFRNDANDYFGCVRFERSKDNPYKYAKLVEKILNNVGFREEHKSQSTKEVWNRNWK